MFLFVSHQVEYSYQTNISYQWIVESVSVSGLF